MNRSVRGVALATSVLLVLVLCGVAAGESPETRFFAQHCVECHDAETHKGGLDLTALKWKPDDPAVFARWLLIHDRIRDGEMPPVKVTTRPDPTAATAIHEALAKRLTAADLADQRRQGRTPLRRLNRVEFENSVRDLLALPTFRIKESLAEDGRAHGFDRLAAALDFSAQHLQGYLAIVDRALDAALCPLVDKPPVQTTRNTIFEEGCASSVLSRMEAIPLVGMQLDPTWTRSKDGKIVDLPPMANAIGIFRHPDSDHSYTLRNTSAVITGWHRFRVSGYSFAWDGKQVVPTNQGGGLSFGCGGKNQHFGTVGLPPNKAAVREVMAWVERGGGATHGLNDDLEFIPASCEKIRDFGNYDKVKGPPYAASGVAIEWIEMEGPLCDQWPPASHQALFGSLTVKEWSARSGVPKPRQQTWPIHKGWSKPKDPYGNRGEKRPPVFVESAAPMADAQSLLQHFVRRAFRRPVTVSDAAPYVEIVRQRLTAGDAFQDAMLEAYRSVLISPDFLLLREAPGTLDAHALANRLSYFLWNSLPDEALSKLADSGDLLKSEVLRSETERLLKDAKSQRFVEDFLGQWLSLREISATQPDRRMYPEFKPWVQESMLMESHAYFAELIANDLPVVNVVKSDFAMLNEPLARHYGLDGLAGIPGVAGFEIRKVTLPPGSHRGGFLTQAAVLKVTAAGTTTSPIKRGAFVMERILGIKPAPPPPDAGSIEPRVDGSTTVRKQLEQHRQNPSCHSCHAKMDGYGFALENFDVTGAWRDRYRAVGYNGDLKGYRINGNNPDYHLGPAVDSSGAMPDGRPFANVDGLRAMLAADPDRLARAFTGHLTTYATGAGISPGDRPALDAILSRARTKSFGVRTLIHEVVQSDLFRNK